MECDKISVIIPVYNVESYLNDCVESVIRSTYSNLEIILIDDGSSDGSGEICDRYAQKDKRVNVIHKKNGGASSARNAGLKAASGIYVGFVDSDDIIDPDMYTVLYNDISENKSQIAVCGHKTAYKGYTLQSGGTGELCVWDSSEAIKELLTDNRMSPSACDKLYSKHLFSEIRFDEAISYGEDRLANYYLIKNAERIVFRDKCLYTYKRRAGSTTTRPFSAKQFTRIEAVKRILTDVEENFPQLRGIGVNCLVKAMLSTYVRSLQCNDFELERDKIFAALNEIWKNDRVNIYPKLKMALVLLKIDPSLYAGGFKTYKFIQNSKAKLKELKVFHKTPLKK